MQTNSESCVYVEGDDEVYGVQDLNDTSLFDEYSYYGAPQSPTFSGGYYFDNQEQSYEYGAYHYENYPVYYLYPTYPGYYALTNPQYGPENVYNTYYVYVPVNTWYYVPHFVYYLPTSTDKVNDIIYDADATESYESDVMSSSMEQRFDNSQEFNWNLYNIDNSSNEIVGEEQTTFQLLYEEYPEMLNDAPVDDEEKSECSNKNLEKDVVANGAEVNECVDVGDQSYDIETNLCEDDVDLKLIKKISSLSIDDVKEDIDENYENAKAFVYNEVLKGYLEIKNQLEELDWECHSLEDILEEEEPESDASETDFNENVAEVLDNIDFLSDEEEDCSSAFVPLSEESTVASSGEALDKDYETMMEEAQPSVDLSVVEEKDKTLSKEKLYTGSLNTKEDDCAPVNSSAVEENDTTDSVLELSLRGEKSDSGSLALSKEELYSGSLNGKEDDCAPVNSSAIEENNTMDSVLELSLREEKSDSGSLALSKEELYSGSLNSKEDDCAPVNSSAVEENNTMDSVLELSLRGEKSDSGSLALSKEELYSGSLNCKEDDCAPVNSSAVEENNTMDSVLELSLRGEKSDSGSRSSTKETDTKMSSQDRVEERLNFDPDIVAPAASKEIQRKKRFSGLRKFLARMCCCVRKRS